MASGPFLGTGAWMTAVSANDSSQKEELGALRFEAGKIFKYIKTGGTVNAGNAVKYSTTTGTTVIATAAATDAVAGVCETALTSAYYGWMTVAGKATATCLTTVVAGDPVCSSGTAGTLQTKPTTTAISFVAGVALDTGSTGGSAVVVQCL